MSSIITTPTIFFSRNVWLYVIIQTKYQRISVRLVLYSNGIIQIHRDGTHIYEALIPTLYYISLAHNIINVLDTNKNNITSIILMFSNRFEFKTSILRRIGLKQPSRINSISVNNTDLSVNNTNLSVNNTDLSVNTNNTNNINIDKSIIWDGTIPYKHSIRPLTDIFSDEFKEILHNDGYNSLNPDKLLNSTFQNSSILVCQTLFMNDIHSNSFYVSRYPDIINNKLKICIIIYANGLIRLVEFGTTLKIYQYMFNIKYFALFLILTKYISEFDFLNEPLNKLFIMQYNTISQTINYEMTYTLFHHCEIITPNLEKHEFPFIEIINIEDINTILYTTKQSILEHITIKQEIEKFLIYLDIQNERTIYKIKEMRAQLIDAKFKLNNHSNKQISITNDETDIIVNKPDRHFIENTSSMIEIMYCQIDTNKLEIIGLEHIIVSINDIE